MLGHAAGLRLHIMRIDKDEARRIAGLARIQFDEAGLDQMAAELSQILDYIDQLNEVPSSEFRVPGAVESTPCREDEVRPSLAIEDIEKNAPRFERGFFVVPKIL